MIKDDQTSPAASPNAQTDQPTDPSVYEQMHRSLYDYHFGHITFLELIERFERTLGIHVLDKAELVDEDAVRGERKDG